MLKKILKNKRGSSYIDVVVFVLCTALVLAFALQLFPVFITKQKIDTLATELIREAEIAGEIGNYISEKEDEISRELGIHPEIEWSAKGKVQLNNVITVKISETVELGLFGDFASFPIELQAEMSGKSEVYWK